jgi:hypothetical protein
VAVSGVTTTSYKILPDLSYTFHHSILYNVLSREDGRLVLKWSRKMGCTERLARMKEMRNALESLVSKSDDLDTMG